MKSGAFNMQVIGTIQKGLQSFFLETQEVLAYAKQKNETRWHLRFVEKKSGAVVEDMILPSKVDVLQHFTDLVQQNKKAA